MDNFVTEFNKAFNIKNKVQRKYKSRIIKRILLQSIFRINKEYEVVGIDNMNDYYDVRLKEGRLEILKKYENYTFYKIHLKDKEDIDNIFEKYRFDYVINLEAQSGVRYSIENSYAYVDSNLIRFVNTLEACRHYPVKYLLYASSSSVYGGNKVAPFSTSHQVGYPVSLYAATKKLNKLMAYTYIHLYNIPTIGLRFFTVYGPWEDQTWHISNLHKIY